MQQKPQRLFFALWPDSETSRKLAVLTKEMLSGIKYAKPVISGNLHLTLIFLGTTKAEELQCYESAAACITGQPFELVFEKLVYRRRQQMLWIEAKRTPEGLDMLLSQLSANLVHCGYTPERRSFLPHMTLARKVRKKISMQKFEPVSWSVTSFSLVESNTYQTGAEYRIIKTWPLEPGTG